VRLRQRRKQVVLTGITVMMLLEQQVEETMTLKKMQVLYSMQQQMFLLEHP